MRGWSPTAALSRAVLLGAGGLTWAVVTGEPVALVLTAPMLLVALPASLRRPTTRPRLETVCPHPSLREGQGVTVHLRVDDDADVEQLTRVTVPQAYVTARPAGGRVSGVYPVQQEVEVSPRRWGDRDLGHETVALTSTWGGFRWGPVPLGGRQVKVLPASAPYDSRAEQPRPKGLVGAHRSDRPGQGTELSGIRVFQPGDRLRRINWRVSARTGDLHVTTMRAEQDAGLLLVVDLLAEHGTSGGIDGSASSLDVTVRAAAALAEHAAARGDRVALRPIGGRGSGIPAGSGARHLRRMLSGLADVAPGSSYDDGTKVQLRVGAGTTVVLLSPLLAEAVSTSAASLTRRGIPTVVIDTLPPDASPDVGDRDPRLADLAWRMRRLEREQVLTALAALGCPVVAWRGRGTVDDVLRGLARRRAHSGASS